MKGYEAHAIGLEIEHERASIADIKKLAEWARKVAPYIDEMNDRLHKYARDEVSTSDAFEAAWSLLAASEGVQR